MIFQILNVGHGFCGYFVADNGNRVLIDCGRSDALWPSLYLPRQGCRSIEHFVVTNYDEDHIADLPELCRANLIHAGTVFYRNRSISPAELRRLKLESGPISPAMENLLQLHEEFVHPVADPPPLSDARPMWFWNSYRDVDDTNNLSLVLFLHSHDLHIVLPGDLEEKGWAKLLERPSFRDELRTVNVFVASHHGRESGYHEPVFDHCQPELVVVSDGPMAFLTQEMAATYGRHASGVSIRGETRKVLTTRSDGTITFAQAAGYPLVCKTGDWS